MFGKTLPRKSLPLQSLPLKALTGSAVVAAAVLAGAPNALAAPTTNAPAAAGTTAGSPAAPTATNAPKAACDTDAHWPGYVQGRPDGFDAHDDGAYMWHNPNGGWAIRVSHPVLPGKANRVVFAGTVTTAGRIGHVVRVRDEKNDVVKVINNGHTLAFRFVNYGWVDGVDFTTTCTPGLRVGLKADGSSMPTRFIHLGDKKVNPGSDPFLIRRRDADTTTVAPPSAGSGTGSGSTPAPSAPAPSTGSGAGSSSGTPAGSGSSSGTSGSSTSSAA